MNDESFPGSTHKVQNYEKRVAARLDEELRNAYAALRPRCGQSGGVWRELDVYHYLCMLSRHVGAAERAAVFRRTVRPKAFILLNLILSFIAAFQAPIS